MKPYPTVLFITSLTTGALAQTPTTDANTLMSLGRFEEAKALLTRTATQTPSMQSTFDAGYGYLRAGQPDSARIWFEKGVSLDEKRVPLNATGVALTYLFQNDAANAEPKLEEVLKKSKRKNATILYRIGEAYTGYLTPDSGSIKPRYPKVVNAARAIDYLNQATERDNKNGAIQLALGDAYYLKQEAGTAVSRYESAIEMGLDPSRAYQRIGDIYWQGRQLNLAVDTYKKAIDANKKYAPAYRQLAELYYLVNRYKDAANYTDQYMQVANDTRPEMLLRSAQFHFLAKEYQQAADVVSRNREMLAKSPIVYRIEGWSQSMLKQPQKAIEQLETFMKVAPEKVIYDDYKYLGQSYLALENSSDSLKAMSDSVGVAYLQKAAPFDTTDNLYSDIAKYYYRAKKHPEAVAALDSAARHGFKADVQDLFRYGMSNYTLGFGRDSLGKFMRDMARFALADSALALAQAGSPNYAPTVLYRAKASYYAYAPEEAVRNGKAKPYFEQFINMVADKAEERTRYRKDLALAFKYLISYHELVTKDQTQRSEWLKRGTELLPENKDLAKIASAEADDTAGQ